MQLLFKCGDYSKAASIQRNMVYMLIVELSLHQDSTGTGTQFILLVAQLLLN